MAPELMSGIIAEEASAVNFDTRCYFETCRCAGLRL